MRKIYVASSWRNPGQPAVVQALREAGHEVYDFRHPAPGNEGFAWSEIDPDWMDWTPERFAELLATHPVAANGFSFDKGGLDWCDTCVLVLPCGRSAHLELGYAAGQGKETYVLLHEDKFEPELMYLLNTACVTSLDDLLPRLATPVRATLKDEILEWHRTNGGRYIRPAGHAVRLLHEVAELCIEAGAMPDELRHAVETEIHRSVPKVMRSFADLAQEAADVGILLDVFTALAGIDLDEAKRKKLDVLLQRKWAADPDGVLWRP